MRPGRMSQALDAGADLAAKGPRRFWRTAVAVIALAGVALVLHATSKYGAGITSLSSAYLDAASSLAKGKGFVFRTGEPMVLWPPLYSMLLASIQLVTGLEPAAFAHIVNAVLFAAVIWLSAYLFRPDLTHNAVYGVLGLCTVLFSVPLSLVYATAWSECLFIPLILLYLIFAQRYWERSEGRSLVFMTFSAALACLTRYIGLTLVLAGAVTVMIAPRMNLRTRLARAVVSSAVSLAPIALWILHNCIFTGTPAGLRQGSTSPTTVGMVEAAGVVLSWYALGLASELVILAWVAVLATRVLSSGAPASRVLHSFKSIFDTRLPVLLFSVVYTIVLLVTSGATELDGIDDRLLSPIYVPATLLLLEFGSLLFGPTKRRSLALLHRAPSLFLALWLCFLVADFARLTAGRVDNGAGAYSSDTWRKSETMSYVRDKLRTDQEARWYSNATDALWELGRVEASELPPRARFNLRDLPGRWPPESCAMLVWFNRRSFRGYYTVQELESVADIEEVARFGDGSVYRASVRDEKPAAGR